MVTLGLRTFIQNPFLNNPKSPFFSLVVSCKSIEPSLLKTKKVKYNKYSTPNNLMIKNTCSFSLINVETPKATKVVCTIHPVISPATTARPFLAPFARLRVKTNILSGPGEIASAAVAAINPKRTSKFNLNSITKYTRAVQYCSCAGRDWILNGDWPCGLARK